MINYRKVSLNPHNKFNLTIVHGFTQNYHYFDYAIPHLAENFNLILIDLRGHGESGEHPGPYGNYEYTEDVLEVLEKENIKKTHFWGTHTGTGIGLALAVNHPDLIEALVLEGAVIPDKIMSRTNELVARVKSIAKTDGVQIAMDDWFRIADWFSYMQEHKLETNASGQEELLRKFIGKPLLCELRPRPPHEVLHKLRQIKLPTLVYNGLYDLDEFKEIADLLEKKLSNVKRKVFPDTGGFPLWENPEVVMPIVREFLESVIRNN